MIYNIVQVTPAEKGWRAVFAKWNGKIAALVGRLHIEPVVGWGVFDIDNTGAHIVEALLCDDLGGADGASDFPSFLGLIPPGTSRFKAWRLYRKQARRYAIRQQKEHAKALAEEQARSDSAT